MRALLDDDGENIARVQLNDDPTRVWLDPEPDVEVITYPPGELRVHGKTGYDEEGSPVYGWTTVAAGPLVALNLDTTGAVEKGTAIIGTDLADTLPDDVVLFVEDLGRFEVSSIGRFPERAELKVRRAR